MMMMIIIIIVIIIKVIIIIINIINLITFIIIINIIIIILIILTIINIIIIIVISKWTCPLQMTLTGGRWANDTTWRTLLPYQQTRTVAPTTPCPALIRDAH
jgi:hypothetical protein